MALLDRLRRSKADDPDRSLVSKEYESTRSDLRSQAEIAVDLAKKLQQLEDLVTSLGQDLPEQESTRLLRRILDVRDTSDRLVHRTSVLFDSYNELGEVMFR